MNRDLRITVNDDRSLTVSETSLEGKRITYTVPADAAHQFLCDRGAVCPDHEHEPRVKVTPTEFVMIDTDDLSPAVKAEVEAVGVPVVTPLGEDRAALRKLRDEFDAVWEARIVASGDMVDIDTRNDRIDSLDQRMRELKDLIAVWEACVAIAEMEEALEDEG